MASLRQVKYSLNRCQVFACLVFDNENAAMNTKVDPDSALRRKRLADWYSDKVVPTKDKSYISQLISGSASFGPKAARRLERDYGMPDRYLDGATGQSAPGDLTIAQYDAGGSMGTGRLILDGGQPGIIKSWRVDDEWLRLNVKHYTSVKNLCIVTGFGPSMMPKYNPGDPLLMDSGIKTAADADGVYFFRVEDYGYIKQLQRIPTERGTIFRAKSYNPDYEPFDITKKMDFEVFGKILTIWKSEQV